MNRSHKFRTFRLASLAIALMAAGSAYAQAPSASPSFAPGFILERSPNIDGVREADEWTVFSTVKTGDGDVLGAASWDSDNLYLMVEGPVLSSAVVYLDVKMDGWLNGTDNYQITVTPNADKADVLTEVYSSDAPSPATALTKVAVGVRAASRTSDGRTVVEIAIPRDGLADLKLAPRTKVGVSCGATLASDPGKTYPADPRERIEPLLLVNELSSGVDGVNLELRIRDRRVVPGQTLSLDFFAKNTSELPLKYNNFAIGGEARVADLVNYLRVRGGELEAGKTLKWGYSTDLPQTMPLGAYVMEARFNLADGRQGTVLSSFEVVEVLDASLDLGNGPISPISERKMFVVIRNNKNRSIKGTVTLKLPAELASGLDRTEAKFWIQAENEVIRAPFKFKPKEPVTAGHYPVTAEVSSGDFTRTLDAVLQVGR